MPPAPPTFSTTTCCPKSSERRGATMRATMSLELPAANGTTIVIGLVGQLCPSAGQVAESRTPRARLALVKARAPAEMPVMDASNLNNLPIGGCSSLRNRPSDRKRCDARRLDHKWIMLFFDDIIIIIDDRWPHMEWNERRLGRHLNRRVLNVLMAVARCGSRGRAAVQLSVSQPAISKAIADLEYALGVRLLDRS